MAENMTEVAIAGAGVIGLATALTLAAEGREVVVFDPNEPGSGASYGNCATLANYGVIPLGSPSVLRNLPTLLFDSKSPLSIRLAALPSLAPWLLRFTGESMPGAMRRNAAALAPILAESIPMWETLAAETGAADLLKRNGVIYAYDTPQARAAAEGEVGFRARYGVRQETLDAAGVAALEPKLPGFAGGGVFFSDAVHVSDPGEVMRRLTAAAVAKGVRFVREAVASFERAAGGVALTSSGGRWRARRLVIAAGAHSKRLAAMAGDAVPLDTERGYHVEWDMEEPVLSRPVCPVSRGFYMIPLQGRLRSAGTVELGGVEAPPNPRRLALIEDGTRANFPGLPANARTWLGFRPSMPDSVPVIGTSRGGDEVILAFGHGHLGVTLAPVTAMLVADMIAGRREAIDPRPYSPARFG